MSIAFGPIRATVEAAMADHGLPCGCSTRWVLAVTQHPTWPSRFAGWHAARIPVGSRPVGWGADAMRLIAGGRP